jgi:hypothetical protein
MSVRARYTNPESGNRTTLLFRLIASVLAGTIAIALNMALLSFANDAGISTSHGGLFRLVTSIISRLGWSLRLINGRSNLPLSPQAIFHILTGLAMAIAYALVIEPKLPGRAFFKGLAYGTVVWCFNAFSVLPLTGEGLAGSRNLNTVGLTVFAVAHMTFFLALSMLYEVLHTVGDNRNGSIANDLPS